MGWCSGGELCALLWEDVLREHIPEKKRVSVFAKMIDVFEENDMDCWEAIEELPEGEEALRKLHPEWYKTSD